MNKELIERMKQNRVPNDLLTDEEYACLESVGKENRRWYSSVNGEWIGDIFDEMSRDKHTVHRIKQDYQPEQEVVRCEVYARNDCLLFNTSSKEAVSLGSAVNLSNFIAYEMADGSRHNLPRVQNYKDEPAEAPKYVLFAKGE